VASSFGRDTWPRSHVQPFPARASIWSAHVLRGMRNRGSRMHPLIAELLQITGTSIPVPSLRRWLDEVTPHFRQASEPSLQRISVPLEQARVLLSRSPDPAPSSELALQLLQAQALGLYAFLEELARLRAAIAGSLQNAAREDSKVRSSRTLLEECDGLLVTLGDAYNGLREGRLDAVQSAGPALRRAAEAFTRLSQVR
jgi:hypothetical protein